MSQKNMINLIIAGPLMVVEGVEGANTRTCRGECARRNKPRFGKADTSKDAQLSDVRLLPV